MEFRLNDTERALRAKVRQFVEGFSLADIEGIEKEIADLESDRQAPTTFSPRLADLGVVGMGWPGDLVPRATQTERFIAHEELDSAGLPTYGLEQSEAVGWMLATFGPAELAAAHLPKILDQTWNYAGGYSEPEAGSDLLALTSRATKTDDGWRVNGQKLWTSGAHVADWIFTLVRTDPESTRHRGLSILMIDVNAPGVTIQPVRVMGGWRVNACFFDDVEVPASHVIGEPGQAWMMMSAALDIERSMSFGGREARLLLARYLDRLGRTDADLDEADWAELGELVAKLEVERLIGLSTVARGEAQEPASGEASMNKVVGPAVAQEVAQYLVDHLGADALLEHGAGTDRLASDAEHFLRASTVLSIIGGTSEVQRSIIAQRALGLPRG